MLFNKLHHVKSPKPEPDQTKTKITTRTKKHFKQSKLNLNGKVPKTLAPAVIDAAVKTNIRSPSKSKIKTGVTGCYNGKNGSQTKNATIHVTKNLSNFTLEAGEQKKSGRKHIAEDDASSGLRVKRERKKVSNHRMHYGTKHERIAPWNQRQKSIPVPSKNWKKRPQSAAVYKEAPFGVDLQPRTPRASGKRCNGSSHPSTRNLLC
eukprot:TRINITY_DN1959_c0_g1_i2.p1 TRINITY_DN1959_c0_g1~~TRINITY_DN1959_c0_g1_i2.p1  ORF type:complete len:206 (-),score=27.63 TRINITY_DN1959_c0_g1_i2:210-827(-)